MQKDISVAALEGGMYRITSPWEDNASQVYIVEGDRAALIEPGPPIVFPDIIEGLRRLDYDPSRISYIIPTHIHADHGGGAGLLAREWPWVRVVVHPRAVSHMVNPERLIASTRFTFGDDYTKGFGPILPVPEDRVWPVKDGETIPLGGRDLQILHTPGHAPHHISPRDTRTGGIFCGEALGLPIEGVDFVLPSAAPPSFDVDVYISSMERIRKLRPPALYYAHDGVSYNVDQAVDRARSSTLACLDVLKGALQRGCSKEETLQVFYEFLVRQGADPKFKFHVIFAGYLSYLERGEEKT